MSGPSASGPDGALAVAAGRVPVGRDEAGLRPTLAVAGLILLLFVGSQLLNAAIPARADGLTGDPQEGRSLVLGRLRLHLAPGWQALETSLGPRLVRGAVALDVQRAAFSGNAHELYDAFVREALAPAASGFSATAPVLTSLGPELSGARGAYTGVFGEGGEIEGQLTSVVVDGDGFVFDAWAPLGNLRALLPDVELMLSTVELSE